jgi:hypothetical protein
VKITNLLLQGVSIGVYELVKALGIPCLVAVQYLQFRVVEDLRGIAVSVFTVGFMVMGTVHAQFEVENAISIGIGILAVVAAATHKATIKACNRQYDVAPTLLLAAQMPSTIACLFLATLMFEAPTRPPWEISVMVIAIGVAGVLMNVTAVRIMSLTPMIYQNLGPVKSLLVVTLSNSWGSAWQTISIVGAAACAAVYIRVRNSLAWDIAPVRSLDYLEGIRKPRIVRAVGVIVLTYCISMLNMISNADNYRLGDLVKHVNGPVDIYACKNYPNSFACDYTKSPMNGAGALTDIIVRANQATVVHARTGDALRGPNCWNTETDCLAGCWCKSHGQYTYNCPPTNCTRQPYAFSKHYYNSITPPAGRQLIIIHGNHKVLSYNRDIHYITQMVDYWEKRGYTVKTLHSIDADRDIMLMARAPVFVQSGGGYSGLAALANTKMGGHVLIGSTVMRCPGSTRNLLCEA